MALTFNQSADSSSLFIPSDQTNASPDWYGYIIAKGPSSGVLQLSDIWQGGNYSGGILVFCAQQPADIPTFVQTCQQYFKQNASAVLYFGWVHNENAPLGSFTADQMTLVSGFPNPVVTINPTPSLYVGSNYVLTPGGNIQAVVNGSADPVNVVIGSSSTTTNSFVAGNQRLPGVGGQITLYLTGPLRGCLQFSLTISRQIDIDNLDIGLRYYYPAGKGVSSLRYPIFNLQGGGQMPFVVTLDPTQPTIGTRSFLAFTNNTTPLASFFESPVGQPFQLTPTAGASLVFSANPSAFPVPLQPTLTLGPAGDFLISATAGAAAANVMCGLQSTEFVTVQPIASPYTGDILRFLPGQNAYARGYPFTTVSPVGPPIDPIAPLLFNDLVGSWVATVRAPGNSAVFPYVAQPQGASLYGTDSLIHPAYPELLGTKEPSVGLPAAGLAIPLSAYAGVEATTTTAPIFQDFERQVLGPARRQIISGTATPIQQPDAPYNGVTPSGVMVGVNPNGNWSQILLGQNLPLPGQTTPLQLSFCTPSAPLCQAFQTSDLFLVVANAANLGTASQAGGPCGSSPVFQNMMYIGDWQMTANVGGNNKYNDYRNVMIVKGRTGPLYDPNNIAGSLVANPDKWTAKDTFGAPSDSPGGAGNTAELAILSSWLQKYFSDAAGQTGTDAFGDFNTLAKDPYWTGILFLRMDISQIPAELAGLMAGISAPALFNAHHFGINISQVQNQKGSQPALNGPSSMFGLIYYVDPAFTPPMGNQVPMPVAPPSGVDYDFRVLMLQVRFANTAVESFQSYAQITVNNLFNMPVAYMGAGGNAYNSIVLTGTYQNNAGQAVYSMGSTSDNTFYFKNNIIRKIDVATAQMSTLNPGTGGSDVISWFGLSGFIDFYVVEDPSQNAFDVFSFGSDLNTDQPRKGLSYSNLGIQMQFPASAPLQRKLTFNSAGIRFDVSTSTPRAGSLYNEFALALEGLITGSKDAGPTASGYLQVVTDAKLAGVDGGKWYGLRYQLSLGTPGDLAGKVGLTSYLLTAWAPDSSDGYRAQVALQLPGTGGGAKLLSLQSVLQLSLGQIVLTFDHSQNSFLLMLTEIALKMFGVLKLPPNGSSLFYLFGNPTAAGRASGLGWYAMYNNEPKLSMPVPQGSDGRALGTFSGRV